MSRLKEILFSEYDGFADKRYKNLDKHSKFIVDDRTQSDCGADGGLLSYFCMIFADVVSENKVKVSLIDNVPLGSDVERWIKTHSAELRSSGYGADMLSFTVDEGNEAILMELSEAIDAIVARGAPRYEVPSYKYVCPRTANSLRRLAKTLCDAWST
jgi:hypothetical protein